MDGVLIDSRRGLAPSTPVRAPPTQRNHRVVALAAPPGPRAVVAAVSPPQRAPPRCRRATLLRRGRTGVSTWTSLPLPHRQTIALLSEQEERKIHINFQSSMNE